MKNDIERNKETIESLKSLPNQMEQLFQLLQNSRSDTSEPVDIDNDSAPLVNDDPIANSINNLLGKTDDNQSNNDAFDNDSDNLREILNLVQPDTEYGPALNADVTSSIERLYQSESAKKMIDKLKEKHQVPENCKFLGVPKVNAEIWPMLPPKTRQRDYSSQQGHQFITLASVAVAKIAETLFTTKLNINKELRENLLTVTMEASSALSGAADDFNRKRKMDIRPTLNTDYSSICSSAKTSAGLLFGDNFSEQLKVSRSTSQILKSSLTKPAQSRYHPYRQQFNSGRLNFQGPSQRMRGGINRPFRGKTWRPYPRQQQPIGRSHQFQPK